MADTQSTPGALLALLLRRRGWSAPRLAKVAGTVSASSIRAYINNRTVPRPGQALAVANALGSRDGHQLLEAWGYGDLAEGFYDAWQQAAAGGAPAAPADDQQYRYNTVEYPGQALSEAGLRVVLAVAAWLQHLEQAASATPAPRRRPSPTHPVEPGE